MRDDPALQGYLAIRNRRGKFPALVIYQWAGVSMADRSLRIHG